MAARKRAAAKKSAKSRLGKVPPAPNPFREEVVVAHGDNPDGHANMTAAAHVGRTSAATDEGAEADRVARAISHSDSTPPAAPASPPASEV